MYLSNESLLVIIFVGLVAGWLAGQIMQGAGFGLIGDLVIGVIGAFVARGVAPLEAAGLAAHVHGRAAAEGATEGLVAGDLPQLVSGVLSRARDVPRRDGTHG